MPRPIAVPLADAVALVHASRRRRRRLAAVFSAVVVPHVALVVAAPMLLLSLPFTAVPTMILAMTGDVERSALRLLTQPDARATLERTTLIVTTGMRVAYLPVASRHADRLKATLAPALPAARVVRDDRRTT